MRFASILVSLGLAAQLLVGCAGGDAPAPPASQAAQAELPPASARVTVRQARVRAVPPGSPATAAFMTLASSGPGAALVGAKSEAAATVELHTHTEVDGAMQMRPVERIDIPADGAVELKPGGLHVMLIGLTRALDAGDVVPLVLVFDDGSEQSVSAPVKPMRGMQGRGGHGQGGHGPHADGQGPHGQGQGACGCAQGGQADAPCACGQGAGEAKTCACGGDPATCGADQGAKTGETCGCAGGAGGCDCAGAGGHGAH